MTDSTVEGAGVKRAKLRSWSRESWERARFASTSSSAASLLATGSAAPSWSCPYRSAFILIDAAKAGDGKRKSNCGFDLCAAMEAAISPAALFNAAVLSLHIPTRPLDPDAAPPATSLSESLSPEQAAATDGWVTQLSAAPQREEAYYGELSLSLSRVIATNSNLYPRRSAPVLSPPAAPDPRSHSCTSTIVPPPLPAPRPASPSLRRIVLRRRRSRLYRCCCSAARRRTSSWTESEWDRSRTAVVGTARISERFRRINSRDPLALSVYSTIRSWIRRLKRRGGLELRIPPRCEQSAAENWRSENKGRVARAARGTSMDRAGRW